MGVNISVHDDATGEEVPEAVWDWYRHAGDREIASLFGSLPQVRHPSFEEDDDPTYAGFRPADFEAWKQADKERVTEWNPTRFGELIALLEANPGYWIQVSW